MSDGTPDSGEAESTEPQSPTDIPQVGETTAADETGKARAHSRRARVIVGAVSAVAVLSGTAYVLASSSTHTDSPATIASTGTPRVAQLSAPGAADTAKIGTPGMGSAATTGSARPGPSVSVSLPKSAKERVAAARSFAAAHGAKLMHPIDPKQVPAKVSAAADQAKVTMIGSARQGTTMRVVTARGDLTGQRELAWVTGNVTKVGQVSCSQTFRFANEAKASTKKNLLVCWRVSAQRSALVVTADVHGRPSKGKTVAVVEREWHKLG